MTVIWSLHYFTQAQYPCNAKVDGVFIASLLRSFQVLFFLNGFCFFFALEVDKIFNSPFETTVYIMAICRK